MSRYPAKPWWVPASITTPYGEYALPTDLPVTRWVDAGPDLRFNKGHLVQDYLDRLMEWAAEENARGVKSVEAPSFAALMTEH